MSRTNPIQTVFGGEISPRLRGRVEADLYRRSLARCENAEPMPQGSVCRRPGTVLSAALPSGPARLIPIRLSDEQDYVLVLTDGALRVYSVNGGVLIDNPGSIQELLLNGDFSAGTTNWTIYMTGSVVVSAGQAVFGPETTSSIAQQVTLTEARDLVLSLDLVAIGTKDVHVVVSQPSGLLTTYFVNGVIGPADGPDTYRWTCHLEAGTYTVQVYVHDSTATIDNISFGYSTAGGSSGYAISAPWGTDDLPLLQYAAASAGSIVYFACPSVAPYWLQRGRDGSWSLQPATFSGAPAEWSDGNWPGVVEVFQSRLWLAATRQQPNTIWASRTGAPLDFNYQTESPPASGTFIVEATDGIVAPVATKGTVRWLRGRQVLLFGTDLGEASLVASEGTLAPTDLHVREESAFGSTTAQAIDLGAEAVYLSRDRRKLRALDYSRESDAWRSRDVTFVAEHIAAARIAEVHFAPDPNGVLVLVLADGTLAFCEIDRAEEVMFWWRADVGGAVLSAAVSNGSDGSVLHLAVERASGTYLESMPWSEGHPDRVYCDSAVSVDISDVVLVDDVAVVAGFDHLEGLDAEVVIDGEYQGRQTVTSGEVTIERVGSLLTVGLPYTGTVTTLPTEGGNPAGTAAGQKRRRPKITLRLNESAMPLVNGQRAAERHPATNLDEPEAPRTGDVSVWDVGWDDSGVVTIEMDLPSRTEVLAIFGDLATN